MNRYIDAEKLKKLIDEKWKELADKNVKVGGGKWDAEISTYLSVLRLIDSLQQEQQEVDLEKDIQECWQNWLSPSNQDSVDGVLPKIEFDFYARHFYELGLNARKEE